MADQPLQDETQIMLRDSAPSAPAFTPECVAADLGLMGQILQEFFRRVLISDRLMRRESSGGEGWTFHETLAHVTSAAEIYVLALQTTLAGRGFSYPGLARRSDLARLNQAEIARRRHLEPLVLVENLSRALLQTAEIARSLTSEQSQLVVPMPIFNRSLSITELFDVQLSHPGIVHAAQLTKPVGAQPLWTAYSADFLHRQLTRFFQLMSLVYWPERGGQLRATIKFVISGPAGGRWFVTVGPDGGSYGEGDVAKASLTIWVANAHTLCRFLTAQIPATRAMLAGKLFIWGDVRLAIKMFSLFSPT